MITQEPLSSGNVRLIQDVWDAIEDDKWMWIVVWGKQRTGKTTLKMQVAYEVYKDWDLVLQSFIFNLSGLLYKIDKGDPVRILTRNKMHNRIPLLLFDDWGGTANKAATQFERSWDIFKGSFDLLGTQLAVLMASMVDPAEATYQLQEKYTHELYVPKRGIYKYDSVEWLPDYHGWRPKKNKIWVETQYFDEVPRDVYREYDEMRMALVAEASQRIKDAMAESQTVTLLKRLQPPDIQLLEIIQSKGPVYYEAIKKELGEDARDVLTRCKARSLIIPIRAESKDYYKYDLTDLAYDILDSLKKATAGQPLSPLTPLQVKGVSLVQGKTPLALDLKKQIAETYRFQGFRATESYDSADPDLVVWKDEQTPNDIIAIKNVAPPCTVNVANECAKEISFAQKYGFDKLHLICFQAGSNTKVYDGTVSFIETIHIEAHATQPKMQVQSLKEVSTPQGNKKNTLTLNLKLRTSPIMMSERVATVGEAFGVGIDDQKEFTIFDNVQLSYNDNDLIYVTGDSGSGKSTFLKLFSQHLQEKNVACAVFDQVKPQDDEVVIDNVGANTEEAFSLLSIVGLSEAFIMLRKHKELSEGQKYRYRLAKLINSKAQCLLIDEFGATLDREMAKVLSYCIQKWARRNGKMVVMATTHRDLMEDFNPNILIDKRFGQTTTIKYFTGESAPFSLLGQMEIQTAQQQDYDALKSFHYLHGNPGAVKHKFKLVHGSETIGIIIYTLSFKALKYRNILFPEYKNNIQKVNAEIERISRIIIHPKYRGIGLAQELVRRTLPLVNVRLVETIAAMAKYNPFFEKAGMTSVGKMEFQPDQKKLLTFLESLGAKPGFLQNKPVCKAFLNKLTSAQFAELQKIIGHNISSIGAVSPGKMKGLQEKMGKGNVMDVLIQMLPVERAYLYWLNPSWQVQTQRPTQPAEGYTSGKSETTAS